MRLTTVVIREGETLTLERDREPAPTWQHDDAIRWLNVENATRSDLAHLFNRLGAEGATLADHITGDDWMNKLEGEQFHVVSLATPTSWLPQEAWFHMVVIPQTIVTVHAAEIVGFYGFVQQQWFNGPKPESTMPSVLLHVIRSHVEEEVSAFKRLRHQVETFGRGLQQNGQESSVDALENIMRRCHHMASGFMEWEMLPLSLEFVQSSAIRVADKVEIFRHGGQALHSARDGIEQLQHRLRELHQQLLLEQQAQTDSRIRILTILSAVFLPLNLIAGIYGMNFSDIPGLHAEYGFYGAFSVMLALSIGMLAYFFWKGWFK
ncbi:MAG: CorA family divalent cation transporter [Gammaproteobacteria bacterium]